MCYKIIERDLHGNKWMQNSTNEEVQQSLSLMIQEDSTYYQSWCPNSEKGSEHERISKGLLYPTGDLRWTVV